MVSCSLIPNLILRTLTFTYFHLPVSLISHSAIGKIEANSFYDYRRDAGRTHQGGRNTADEGVGDVDRGADKGGSD